MGDIRLFVVVAEVGNLKDAAPKFGFSVPAASVRLTKLENNLGVKLFNRSVKRFVLTEEGENYLRECTAALRIIDDAELKLRSGQKSASGIIKISVATDFGRKYLSGWIDEFLDIYPDVKISLVLDDAFSDILQDEIDVAIRFARPMESLLVVRRLGPNYRVLCASPAYLRKYGIPQNPEDLDGHEFIVLKTRNGLLKEYFFEKNGICTSYTPSLEKIWEVNDGEMATNWAIGGRGITRKTIWDAMRSLRSGDLEVVLPEYTAKEEGVFAVRHNNKYLPLRINLLLDFLANKFSEERERAKDLLDLFAPR